MKHRWLVAIVIIHASTLNPITRSQMLGVAACCATLCGFIWWDVTYGSDSNAKSVRFVDYGHVVTFSTLGSLLASVCNASSSSYSEHLNNRMCSAYVKVQPHTISSSYIGPFTPQEQVELDLFQYRIKNNAAKSGYGLLLQGVPGSGKTSFVREFARRSGSMLFIVNTAQLNSGFSGDGAVMIDSLFNQAQQECKRGHSVIVFFDELDALGSRDGAESTAAALSQRATLTSLLVKMDAIPKEMLVIGATNKVEDIDPALKRNGRIDVLLTKELPDKEKRHAFLVGFQQRNPCLTEMDVDALTDVTDQCSYGDLQALVNRCVALHETYGNNLDMVIKICLEELRAKKEYELRASQSERRIQREEEHLAIAKTNLNLAKGNTGLGVVNTVLQFIK